MYIAKDIDKVTKFIRVYVHKQQEQATNKENSHKLC